MLKQGETTTIMLRILEDNGVTPKELDSTMRIKVVISNSHNVVKYCAESPSVIEKIDASTYKLLLPHSITKEFCGALKMEIAVYSDDMVLIAKEQIAMNWQRCVISKYIYED